MSDNNKHAESKSPLQGVGGKPPPLGGWGVLLLFIGLLIFYLFFNPTRSFQSSNPGMDNRGKGVASSMVIKIGEFFEKKADKESDLKENWPRFRGADYDNIYKTPRKLASSLQGKAGEILWSK
ncbi:MAG TPA: hypothetical protein PLB87_01955, partial [Prolixibacteraceae bacterium]|nr:hypothetical protein [Prolixibacteraceae bacterium]